MRNWTLRRGVSIFVVLAFLAHGVPLARGADPQPYDVKIADTGLGDVNDVLLNSSLLVSLREKSPVGGFALVARARNDIDRLTVALHSFGYYRAKVTIGIDGHDLSDPELPSILDAIPSGRSAHIEVGIVMGPLYHLRKIEIDGAVPEKLKATLNLSPGDPVIADQILAAGANLLAALQEDGYALAKVDPPVAIADDAARVIDVSFKVDAGAQVDIGAIAIKGLKDVHESFVRESLTVAPGQRYATSKIEEARQSLLTLGVFSGVAVHAAERLDAQGRIPLTFDLQERPQHAVAVSGAYSTDLGVSLSASWSHRNLFGNAEQLNLSAADTGLGGNATSGIGYNLTAQFLKPTFLVRDQILEVDLGGIKQSLDAYKQTAESLGGHLNRKFSRLWSGSIGLTFTHETILQETVDRTYQLIAVPFVVTYDSTGLLDPLAEPLHGVRASVTVTPTQAFGNPGATFAILQAAASAYFDLSGATGRSVVALRALAGSVLGASQFDLPPDQRFYAGGSATVRGFKYQSVGPLFPDAKPIGGLSIDTATVEFRQRLFGDFGAAAFLDAGQVGATSAPFSGTLRAGAGAGLRYYTPIGPIRLDVAVPITPVPRGDSFELYIGLGQAF